mgnify:CR=1 FL=1
MSVVVISGIAYAVYADRLSKKTKIIPDQVKHTEASINQEETKSSPFFSSKSLPECFNFISDDRKDFTDSGQALARARGE